ncbi:MAG: CDP-alcohol phosphatidyltransferase family protein [Turicibacter sp.]|nr:CDP-alcohol phosphatidyltransferase family protein [Turicibacter sp.]
MKYIPNALSIFRLFMIIPLLLFAPFSVPFMVAYVLACLSDMLDGPIARKFNVTSQFGAALDGGADVLLVIVVLFRLIPVIEISRWIVVWIVIAVVMKLSASVVGYMRHKEIIFLHTYLGKTFIFLLCLFPIFYTFMAADPILIVLLSFAMIVFAEDIYINATSKEVDLNDKGILFRDKKEKVD